MSMEMEISGGQIRLSGKTQDRKEVDQGLKTRDEELDCSIKENNKLKKKTYIDSVGHHGKIYGF